MASVAWAFFDNKKTMDIDLRRQDFCVMAAQNCSRMRALLTEFKGCHKANIILAFPVGVIPQLGELKSIFEEAWNAGVVDIAVVLESSLSCEVFSYVPFKGDGVCHDTTPILLNSWKVSTERAEDFSKTSFPANKISNLQTCELSMTYLYHSSFNIYKQTAEYAAKFMNASLKSIYSAPSNFVEPLDNATDILLRRQYLSVDTAQYYTFSLYVEFTRIALAVPRRTISSMHWRSLITELSPMLWCGIGLSFAVSVVTFYALFMGKKDVFQIILLVLQLLLGQPWACSIGKWHFRMYLLSWLLFSLIVNASYMCSLLSNLTMPFSQDSIKNMHDFLESGLTIHVPAFDMEFIKNNIFRNSPYEVLVSQFQSVNKTYNDMVDEDSDDIAYIINEDDFYDFFEDLPYRVLGDEPLMTRVTTPMVLAEPSPYERLFTAALLQAEALGVFRRELGYFDDLEDIATWRRKNSSKRTRVPLSLESLLVVFMIWLIGCGFALLAFVFECVHHYLCYIYGCQHR